MKLILLGTIITLVFLSVGGRVDPIYAQEDKGELRLTTSPPVVKLSTAPGKSISTDLTVRNGGSKNEVLKIGLLKFSAQGDSGKPKIMERASGDDYFDWVSFTPSAFEAPPGQWVSVKMTITVPKTAAFGYYYAVTFSRAKDVQPALHQATLVGAPAILVLLEAESPGAIREIHIDSFEPRQEWQEFLPADFQVVLANKGNVHVAPHGNIFILQGGKELGRLDINTPGGNILPTSIREFDASWNDGYPRVTPKERGGKVVLDSQGHPEMSFDWDLSRLPKLRFGHYEAHLVLAYDNGSREVSLDSTTGFWVIPWRIFGGIALIALFIGIGIFASIRGTVRKMRN